MDKTATCSVCEQKFTYQARRGRPPSRCPAHHGLTIPPSAIKTLTPIQQRQATVLQLTPASPPQDIKLDSLRENAPFIVIVGNLGVAFSSAQELKARQAYTQYVNKSCQGYGQIGFESVELLKQNEDGWLSLEKFDPLQELR